MWNVLCGASNTHCFNIRPCSCLLSRLDWELRQRAARGGKLTSLRHTLTASPGRLSVCCLLSCRTHVYLLSSLPRAMVSTSEAAGGAQDAIETLKALEQRFTRAVQEQNTVLAALDTKLVRDTAPELSARGGRDGIEGALPCATNALSVGALLASCCAPALQARSRAWPLTRHVRPVRAPERHVERRLRAEAAEFAAEGCGGAGGDRAGSSPGC